MEGGDDIGVQGPGIEKSAGASGFDWGIASSPGQGGDDQAMVADLACRSSRCDVLEVGVRDRYNEVEALSGGAHDDTLRGDDAIPSQNGTSWAAAASSAATRWTRPGWPGSRASTRWCTDLPTPLSRGRQPAGRACDLHGNVWGEGNILLGGPGDDTIDGGCGNDIIDGDRYLTVRLSVRDDNGVEIRSARSMAELAGGRLRRQDQPQEHLRRTRNRGIAGPRHRHCGVRR